jgi:hypothetical protein
MCVYMHSRFIENHPIRILEDGSLISEGVLSQIQRAYITDTRTGEETRNKEMSNPYESHGKCADLELKLLSFRSQTCGVEEKFHKRQEDMEQRNRELSMGGD